MIGSFQYFLLYICPAPGSTMASHNARFGFGAHVDQSRLFFIASPLSANFRLSCLDNCKLSPVSTPLSFMLALSPTIMVLVLSFAALCFWAQTFELPVISIALITTYKRTDVNNFGSNFLFFIVWIVKLGHDF